MSDAPRKIARKAIQSLLNLHLNLPLIASKATTLRKSKYGSERNVSTATLSRIMGSRPWQVGSQLAEILQTVLSQTQADLRRELLQKYPIVVIDYCPKRKEVILDQSVKDATADAILTALCGGEDMLTVHLPDCLLGAVAWLGRENSGILIAVVNTDLTVDERRRIMAHELEDARQRLLSKIPFSGGPNVEAAWG